VTTVQIKLTDIRLDGKTQTRAAIDADTVAEYAEALRGDAGALPAIVVFQEIPVPKSGKVWLADGFHRVHAAKAAGLTEIAAEVRPGTWENALRYALGANGTHGLRRTRADVANAIRLAYENRKALGLPDVPSARAVAELVGCSDKTAGDQLRNFRTWTEAPARTGADGKTYPARPVPPPPPVRPEPAAPRQAPPELVPMPPRPPASEVDAIGRAIPPEALPMWTRRHEVQAHLTALGHIRAFVRQAEDALAGKTDLIGAETNFSSLKAHLDQAYSDFETMKPYAVCPSCEGLVGCRLCAGRRMISKFRWDTAVNSDVKKRVLDAVKKGAGQ